MRELAVDLQPRRSKVHLSGPRVELAQQTLSDNDATQLLEKVEVEEGAPELTVCDPAEPDVFLQLDRGLNRPVLCRAQHGGGDLATLTALSRDQQLLRAQQAADVIRPKGRAAPGWHRTTPIRRSLAVQWRAARRVRVGGTMDLSYGEEYEQFRAGVQDFISEHSERSPRRGPDERLRPTPEYVAWQELLIEHGYHARTIPREYGGYGAEPDILKSVIIAEEFSRSSMQGPGGGGGASMLVPTLLEHGRDDQKKRWIRPALTGGEVWCQGYSEPGSGSDLASLQTSAKEDGDDFLINGQKIWTSGAQVADMIFILVRTEPDAPKHSGISYILLRMDTPGIEIQPLMTMTGQATFNQVFLTDVRVPKANVVGARGEGWIVANTTLRHERNMLGNASQTEGLLRRLEKLMREETSNGASIMLSPTLRDRFLRLQARTRTMRYHSMRLLTCTLRGEAPGVAGLVVKLQGCQLNHDIAALAIDAMGELGTLYYGSKYERARGFWQREHMLSLGLIIGGGTAQIQKNIISERGLGMPREPKVAAAGR